jgi:succinate dehydrogenase / fumarate reductase, membrane anchor subunit
MSTNRIVVGAHYGMRDWLAQRITAVVMAVYTLVMLGVIVFGPPLTYFSWAGLFASVWMKVLTLLTLAALAWHAWVGVRDIFMDYVKPTGVRLTLQVLTLIALGGYLAWAVIILWRV